MANTILHDDVHIGKIADDSGHLRRPALDEGSAGESCLISPPREYSLLPFWFWNDDLSESEIIRQIADFEAHGVYGFVIHPRVGLPRSIGWMSDALIKFMHVAITEAARRQMKVILYDEGMYPSGSSCGQVVAADKSLACRALAMLEQPRDAHVVLPENADLVGRYPLADGRCMLVFDRPAGTTIRGLHYVGEGPAEDEPPMGDILNPATTQKILELVHDRFYKAFGEHFGSTVIAIFTDEPNPLGRCSDRTLRPGTRQILPHLNRLLGYDISPYLPALWRDDIADAERYRRDYHWAIQRRLEETWYMPLSEWCQKHHVALCGHPAVGDEIGTLRHFQIPGQDLVWRWVMPDTPSALEGPESVQAKCSSSAMIHGNRRRNSNEFGGAYGPDTTFDEIKWLAWWCLVRGVNMLIPHAFYYSIRGVRKGERPPQIGPHTPWWDDFKKFADTCRRLCWINTDSRHICDVAILTGPEQCPWRAARYCFEHQRDFNYLENCYLKDAASTESGLRIGGMHYRTLICEDEDLLTPDVQKSLAAIEKAGRLILWSDDRRITLDQLGRCDIRLERPSKDLRYRHVIKESDHYYLLFNEGAHRIESTFDVAAEGTAFWIDPVTGEQHAAKESLHLSMKAHEIALLRVCGSR